MHRIFAALAVLLILSSIGELQAQSVNKGAVPGADRVPPKQETGRPEKSQQGTEKIPAPKPSPKSQKPKEKQEQEGDNWWNWFVTFIRDVKFNSALLVIFTGLLTWATIRISIHSTRTERAYIDISHKSPPGLEIDPAQRTARVEITVTNRGNTPAAVTDVFFDLAFQTLPPTPKYHLPRYHEFARIFLVKGSEFTSTVRFVADSNELNAAKEDQTPLWVFGYVDYRDIFGKRHRAGYMRRYHRFDDTKPGPIPGIPEERENNLIFDPIPGYNYDRRRWWWKREGSDWREKN